MQIKEYDLALAAHDWYWDYSDDPMVRDKYSKQWNVLKAAAQISEHHKQLLDAYSKNNFNNLFTKPELNSVRILVGAITVEELQVKAAEERAKIERETEENTSALEAYVADLRQHDWEYWKHQVEHARYVVGYRQRIDLRDRTIYGSMAPRFLEFRGK